MRTQSDGKVATVVHFDDLYRSFTDAQVAEWSNQYCDCCSETSDYFFQLRHDPNAAVVCMDCAEEWVGSDEYHSYLADMGLVD